MLKAVNEYDRAPMVKISQSDPNELFAGGLEYNPPARGVWNIVHTGMLIPEAHQIFCCAYGCLRGVILTAAEMNAIDRLSWISVSESDMFDGTLESNMIEGVCDIIERLGKKPRNVLLFLSCIHLFAGCDFTAITEELSRRYSDIHFTDCYMTPTMRKTISPDAKMRMQLYDALSPLPLNKRSVSIIGNDRATDEESELVRIIKNSGCELKDLTMCKSYEEYLAMAESAVNITYLPTAFNAGEELEKRLGAKHLYLPNSFDYDRIRENYKKLCNAIGAELPELDDEAALTEQAFESTLNNIGDIPVAVDLTAVTRPFEFARVLSQHGFNLRYIITDTVSGEELDDYNWLKENRPETEIYSALNVNMLYSAEGRSEKILAVGQKAAYYFATDNFVDVVQNGGFYGFSGIRKLLAMMTDANAYTKDRRTVIQHKGWGCASCC